MYISAVDLILELASRATRAEDLLESARGQVERFRTESLTQEDTIVRLVDQLAEQDAELRKLREQLAESQEAADHAFRLRAFAAVLMPDADPDAATFEIVMRAAEDLIVWRSAGGSGGSSCGETRAWRLPEGCERLEDDDCGPRMFVDPYDIRMECSPDGDLLLYVGATRGGASVRISQASMRAFLALLPA
jgi:hypothetical protein